MYANSHILVYPIPGADGSVRTGDDSSTSSGTGTTSQVTDLADVLTDDAGNERDISVPPGAVARRPRRRDAVHRGCPAPTRDRRGGARCVSEPFLQVVYDVEIARMAFGRTCLIGDAGFVARPHAAAGTAKAAANAWALADALAANGSVDAALASWEPGQLELGRQLLERTRRLGSRSQVTGTWDPLDADNLFRLREDGP